MQSENPSAPSFFSSIIRAVFAVFGERKNMSGESEFISTRIDAIASGVLKSSSIASLNFFSYSTMSEFFSFPLFFPYFSTKLRRNRKSFIVPKFVFAEDTSSSEKLRGAL